MEYLQGIISDLIDKGYPDDEQFAAIWVERRPASRSKGRRAIAKELSRGGVCRTTVEGVISHYPKDMDLARKLAFGRVEVLGNLDEATFCGRLADYLVKRGFDFQEVMPLVDELWEAFGGPENRIMKGDFV